MGSVCNEIDNFEKLGKVLIQREFNVKQANVDSFWKVELIRRKKDNASFKSSQLIASYNVHSYDDLMGLKELITSICKATGARAYLYINKKSEMQASLDLMSKLSMLVASHGFFYNKSVYESVMSSTTVTGNKRVLVDADDIDNEELVDLVKIVDSCMNQKTLKERCKLLPESLINGLQRSEYTGDDGDKFYDNAICVVPTPHGWHIVSHSFDKEQFRSSCVERFGKTFDVHTNNLVLLYYYSDTENC